MTTTERPGTAGPSTLTAAGRYPAVPAARSVPDGRPPRAGRRLTGVDAARGLAVLGMIVAHVAAADPGAPLWQAVHGRAAVLFGVLAGVGLALMAGPALRAGTADARAALRRRVAVRAVLLIVFGVALAGISSGPMVILAVYGVEFLLVLPVLCTRARTLATAAAVWAMAGPLLSFALRSGMSVQTLGGTVSPTDLTAPGSALDALVRVLLTGAYPVLTWMPFLLLGMALGRLDLPRYAGRLVAGGLGGALLGYGGSWLAVDVLGGRQTLLDSVAPAAGQLALPPDAVLDLLAGSAFGVVSTTTPAWLLTAGGHSGSPFDVVGAAGVAVAVLGLCLLAARAVPALLTPLAATGALALTLYAGHIAVLAAVGDTAAAAPWAVTGVFVVAAVLFATGWRHLAGRGPLEAGVHAASIRAGGAR
ncbi:heparan-alpha-glucosaminide N-acetyltransferase domain-containing protein [Pseudonocardia nantongensis]|uniref:heparan-alpha-glucosaminide N-acetyltransferase domain-containing protein n=1 Tax=Pseudonocardia nantongensis TaxID=1181885 RepID=UPI00397CE9CE